MPLKCVSITPNWSSVPIQLRSPVKATKLILSQISHRLKQDPTHGHRSEKVCEGVLQGRNPPRGWGLL